MSKFIKISKTRWIRKSIIREYSLGENYRKIPVIRLYTTDVDPSYHEECTAEDFGVNPDIEQTLIWLQSMLEIK
jgi:hypothetical protein